MVLYTPSHCYICIWGCSSKSALAVKMQENAFTIHTIYIKIKQSYNCQMYFVWNKFSNLRNKHYSFIFSSFSFYRYASECHNYDLVMSAARYYWNNICYSLSTPIERHVLHEPIKSLLAYISKVSKNRFDSVSILFEWTAFHSESIFYFWFLVQFSFSRRKRL